MIKFEKISLNEWINWFESRGIKAERAVFEESYKNIQLPRRSTEWSAGYDFFAPVDMSTIPGEWTDVPTGIRFVTDNPNLCLVLMPRSGLGFKHNMRLANTVALIDADYQFSKNEGHIIVRFTSESVVNIPCDKAYVQGIILPYFKTDDDNATEKRDGGFGSTDTMSAEHLHTDAYDHALSMEH